MIVKEGLEYCIAESARECVIRRSATRVYTNEQTMHERTQFSTLCFVDNKTKFGIPTLPSGTSLGRCPSAQQEERLNEVPWRRTFGGETKERLPSAE